MNKDKKHTQLNDRYKTEMRYLIDGCFDGFHYGHVHALFQAKQMCDILVAATHDDAEMKRHKNQPLFTFKDRVQLLQHCKFVDEVVTDPLPYNVNCKTLDTYNCDMYVHGDELVLNNDKEDSAHDVKINNRYAVYKVTPGISSTNLLYRLYSLHNNTTVFTNQDTYYLTQLLNKLTESSPQYIGDSFDVVVITGTWDLFTVDHLNFLLDIKKIYKHHKLICNVVDGGVGESTVYNSLERAIVLSAFRCIDHVVIDGNFNRNLFTKVVDIQCDISSVPKLWESLQANWDLFKSKCDKEHNKVALHKQLKSTFLDSGIYHSIIESQFDVVLKFLQTHAWKPNDIIVFDIDEVCLSNIMYTCCIYKYSDVSDNFDSDVFNFTSGLNPPIKSIQAIFDFIHQHNLVYAFVTGRRDNIRALTERNLELVGFNKYTSLHTCPDDYVGSMSTFKLSCRQALAQYYNIVCCVGDQVSDMSFHTFGIPFLIFNPFYTTH